MTRLVALISVILISIVLASSFASNVFAQTFNPLFGVEVFDPSPGAHPDVLLRIEQNDGADEPFKKVVFTIPAGFDIAALPADPPLEVGVVTLCISLCNVYHVFNTADTQGHKAIWRVASGLPPLTIDVNVTLDENVSSGHTLTFEWPTSFLPSLQTPLSLDFYIRGQSADFFMVTNPTLGGDYVFGADITSINNVLVQRQLTLTIPGSVTPTGTDVTSDLGGSVSVTFSEVTGEGVTSRTTQTDPPPEGSGQFQLPEGFYYDLSTTAVFTCPCTIVLPYDPDTNPNPRMYHLEDGVWVDVTTSVDTTNHTVTGIVSSFSLFAPGSSVDAGVNYLSPIEALQKISNPIQIEGNRTLPVNFALYDSGENFITNSNVSVQIVQIKDALGNPIVPVQKARITAKLASKKHYQANLNLHDLGLDDGTYRIRVILVDTVLPQIVDLVPKI